MDLSGIDFEESDALNESEDEDPMAVLRSFLLESGEGENYGESASDCGSFEKALCGSAIEDGTATQVTNSESKLNVNNNKTVIHSGDTDSSDDEENKYCFEAKYSESGKTLKKLLTEKTRESPLQEKSLHNFKNSSWNKNKKPVLPAQKQTEVSVDGILGLRIVNPLVSSAFVTEKMHGKEAIPLSRLKQFVANGDVSSDWVVAAVIVKKSSMRTSQKGSQYYIWKLSDLKGDLKTFSLFLFRNAAKELWKTSEGTGVAILNPGVLDNRDGSGDEATLSVDNIQKVLIMGSSKDLGYCKARKKNGETCMSFVNKSQCEFCIYHLKQEYKKCSARAELQSRMPRGGLTNIRNKVLGKHEVFYAGKSFTAVPAKRNVKQQEKDNKTLSSLCGMKKPQSLFQSRLVPLAPVQPNTSKSLTQVESDAKRLKSLQQSSESKSPPELKETTKKLLALGVPQLGNGSSFRIDLTMPASRMQKEQAKINAKKYIQLHGPIKREDPNSVKKDEKSKKRRLNDSSETLNSSDSTEKPSPKESSLKSKFLELMEAKSRHTELLAANEERLEEQYFNRLEQKERLELKMLETFKISCKAVRCLKCKYTALSASDLCKNERHPLKVLDAMKRFFKCGHCSNRTVTLDLIPLYPCSNCASCKWVRAPMIREKRTHLNVQPLSIRGDEEMFLGSVANEGNLNLLVPDSDVCK